MNCPLFKKNHLGDCCSLGEVDNTKYSLLCSRNKNCPFKKKEEYLAVLKKIGKSSCPHGNCSDCEVRSSCVFKLAKNTVRGE